MRWLLREPLRDTELNLGHTELRETELRVTELRVTEKSPTSFVSKNSNAFRTL